MTTTARSEQGWLRRFAHFPRQTFLRRAIFQIHLWAGIGIGLLATVAGVSGSAIVYKHSLETHLTPSLYRTTHAPRGSADGLMQRARALHPGWTLEYIDTGGESAGASPASDSPDAASSGPASPSPWIFYLAPPGTVPFDRDTTAFLDPATGDLLGQQQRSTALHPATLIDWISELHYRLLAGNTGLIMNGVGALLLFVLCISGIILWWPGRRHWRSHLKIHWHARWPRLNWDLHNVIGFWIALPLAVLALTGAFFCFYAPAAAGMMMLLGGNVTQAKQLFSPPQSTIPAASGPVVPISIDSLLRASLALHPDCALAGITPPTSATSAVLFRLVPPHAEDRGDYVQLAFDQYSGNLLSNIDSRRLGFPIRAVLFMGPLHFGTFAGNWSKIAWILVGLSPGVLFITGFIMWWRRIRARSRSALRGSQILSSV
jgi:uncharacterized iron-regulated membrane protein